MYTALIYSHVSENKTLSAPFNSQSPMKTGPQKILLLNYSCGDEKSICDMIFGVVL